VPTWVALVEAELQRVLKGKPARTKIALALDDSPVSLPADLIRGVSLTVESSTRRQPIELTTYERLQSLAQQWGTTSPTGVPVYGAVVGDDLYLIPVPDTSYSGTLIYDATLDPLTEDNLTNWALTNHPDLYLYGCALHGSIYLQNDERVPLWQARFDLAKAQIEQARDDAEFGANTPIIRPRSALGE
jgi:hypothetical protein